MSEGYKQILGDWYWRPVDNQAYHRHIDSKHRRESYYSTLILDSKFICAACNKEACQKVTDACLLVGIRGHYTLTSIQGQWKILKTEQTNRAILVHVHPVPYRDIYTLQHQGVIKCADSKCNQVPPNLVLDYCSAHGIQSYISMKRDT